MWDIPSYNNITNRLKSIHITLPNNILFKIHPNFIVRYTENSGGTKQYIFYDILDEIMNNSSLKRSNSALLLEENADNELTIIESHIKIERIKELILSLELN